MIEEKIEFPFQYNPVFRKLAELASLSNLNEEERKEYEASLREHHEMNFEYDFMYSRNFELGKSDGRFLELFRLAGKLEKLEITTKTFRKILGDDMSYFQYFAERNLQFDVLGLKLAPDYSCMNQTVLGILDKVMGGFAEYAELDPEEKRLYDLVKTEFCKKYKNLHNAASFGYKEGVKAGKEEIRRQTLERCESLNIPEDVSRSIMAE